MDNDLVTGYLAPHHLEEALLAELKEVVARYDRLILAKGAPQKVYFVDNIWFNPQRISFASIKDAATQLKSLQRLWAFYPYKEIRKGALISSHLPYFSPKPLAFGGALPTKPLGSFTLLDKTTLLAAANSSSCFANGEVKFEETPIPPSRAYLKLWELFTKIGNHPTKKDTCLDLGASPGSWSFVLQKLGASVIAVDKAQLSPDIANLTSLTYLKRDGFTLFPKDLPSVTWVFSDMICYPEKLLEWLNIWLSQAPHLFFVCTIKFQGKQDYEILRKFEKIERSEIFHLFHNKHELTWYRKGVD